MRLALLSGFLGNYFTISRIHLNAAIHFPLFYITVFYKACLRIFSFPNHPEHRPCFMTGNVRGPGNYQPVCFLSCLYSRSYSHHWPVLSLEVRYLVKVCPTEDSFYISINPVILREARRYWIRVNRQSDLPSQERAGIFCSEFRVYPLKSRQVARPLPSKLAGTRKS